MNGQTVRYYIAALLLGILWCCVFVVLMEGTVSNSDHWEMMRHSFSIYIAPFVVSALITARFGRRFILHGHEVAFFATILLLPLVGAMVAGFFIGIEFWIGSERPLGAENRWDSIIAPLFYAAFAIYFAATKWFVFFPLSLATVFGLRWISRCPLYRPIEWDKYTNYSSRT